MPPVVLAPFVKFKQTDFDGNPLAGGKLYSYVAGTSTPQVTYSDPQGTIPASNPIVLADDGSAWVYLQAGVSYKLIQYSQDDVLVWSQDQVLGSGGGAGSGGDLHHPTDHPASRPWCRGPCRRRCLAARLAPDWRHR